MRILLTGAGGQLGAHVLRRLRDERADAVAWTGSRGGESFGYPLRSLDLADSPTVAAALRETAPDVVLHTAALSSVADCHRDPATARRVNVEATDRLADLCASLDIRLVFVSTDLVFDGNRAPYREEDPPAPLSAYGRTKAEAEGLVLALPRAAVVRVSLLYGPALHGRPTFFTELVAALRAGRPVRLFEDEWRTPLDLDSTAHSLLAVARSDFAGLLHLGGPERMSRLEMGQRTAAALGLDARGIGAARRADLAAPEPRPRDVSLDSGRWRASFPQTPWPTLEDALRDAGDCFSPPDSG